MKLGIALIAGAVFCFEPAVVAVAQQGDPAVPDRIAVSIDTQQTAEPVSKYEFGMFIEHIRSLIYRSL
jgi:alpha-N-arabinofuranosidase